jgi:hypothetical protein
MLPAILLIPADLACAIRGWQLACAVGAYARRPDEIKIILDFPDSWLERLQLACQPYRLVPTTRSWPSRLMSGALGWPLQGPT